MQIQRVNTKVIIIYITFIINSCNTYSEKEYYTNSANVRNSVMKQLVKRVALVTYRYDNDFSSQRKRPAAVTSLLPFSAHPGEGKVKRRA